MPEQDEIRSALEKVGLKLEPLEPFTKNLHPVATAYKLEVPVDSTGNPKHEVAEVLELLTTPRDHTYSVEFQNFERGGIHLSHMGVSESSGQTAANAGRALLRAAYHAQEDIQKRGIVKAIIECFPGAWDWGEDYK